MMISSALPYANWCVEQLDTGGQYGCFPSDIQVVPVDFKCLRKEIHFLQGDLKGTIQQDSIDLQRLLSKERGPALKMFSSIIAFPCFA